MSFVSLAMGGGGRLYRRLVEEYFLPAFANAELQKMNDAAVCGLSGDRIALTTDSFVVQPRFFPGGDIGRLAVCGTVNDLAVSGARPMYLTCSMIIEAGFPLEELARICTSMAETARQAGVQIVTGDTKVVEKGGCDGLFINTAGVGLFDSAQRILPQRPAVGDAILVSGNIGYHGMAILSARENFGFEPPIPSDVAPLNQIIDCLLRAVPQISCLRDATRGGVAAVLNEWAQQEQCHIVLQREQVPVAGEIATACDLLGLDPLYLANEGRFVAAVNAVHAQRAISALHAHTLGKDAAIIGYVTEQGQALVSEKTVFGANRIVDMPEGERFPRIC